MTEETKMVKSELEDMEADGLDEREIREAVGNELVEEYIQAFVEYRYPSDWRDDAPLPEDFEQGVVVTGYRTPSGDIYVEASDAAGHGDGTGELYLISNW